MSEEKMQFQAQQVHEQVHERDKVKQEGKELINLQVDLADIITETYSKAYLAYRVSLENWFLLNEILAFVQNEKLTSKEIQNRLQRLFSMVNTEIVRELVKLNQLATARMKRTEERNTEKEKMAKEDELNTQE